MERTRPPDPGEQRTRHALSARGMVIQLLILLILGAVGWELWAMQQKVDAARDRQEALQSQARELKEKNAALEKDLQEGPAQDKMEDLARSELGLAKSNEYIFYDRQN